MDDETTNDLLREGTRQELTSRGLFGICFQIAWARAARDMRYRQCPYQRIGVKRDGTAPRRATDGNITEGDENVFERVLI